MIIVRLAQGVSDHFPARRSEWVLSGALFGWGWLLIIAGGVVFSSSPSYDGLAALAPERTWGLICFWVGFIRLLALLVNGTFAQTWYGHWSPHIRGSLAFVSCFVWTSIAIGIFNSGVATTGIVIYPSLLILEITNVYGAWQDAGEADRRKKDGP